MSTVVPGMDNSTNIVRLKDYNMDRRCALVRSNLLVLKNHKHQMDKDRIIDLCEDLISEMMNILELMERDCAR
jgi:hypothetical protein